VSPWQTKREGKKGGGVCPSPAVMRNRGGGNGERGASGVCACNVRQWGKQELGLELK
jgi:hypothetical protein